MLVGPTALVEEVILACLRCSVLGTGGAVAGGGAATSAAVRRTTSVIAVVVAAVAVTAVSAPMPCACVACRPTVAAVAIVDHGVVVASTSAAAGVILLVANCCRVPAATAARISHVPVAATDIRGLSPGVVVVASTSVAAVIIIAVPYQHVVVERVAAVRAAAAAVATIVATVYTSVAGTGAVVVIATQSCRRRSDRKDVIGVSAAAAAVSAVLPWPCVVGRTGVAAVVVADQEHVVAAAAAAVVISTRLPHAEAGSVVDADAMMGLVAPWTHTALAPAAVATIVVMVYTGVSDTSAVAEFRGIPVATVAGITDGSTAASAVRGLPPGAAVCRTLSVAATTSAAVRRTLAVVAVVVAAVAVTAVSAAGPCPCVACRATIGAVAIVDHGVVAAATSAAAVIIIIKALYQDVSVEKVAAVRSTSAVTVCRVGAVTGVCALEGAESSRDTQPRPSSSAPRPSSSVGRSLALRNTWLQSSILQSMKCSARTRSAVRNSDEEDGTEPSSPAASSRPPGAASAYSPASMAAAAGTPENRGVTPNPGQKYTLGSVEGL